MKLMKLWKITFFIKQLCSGSLDLLGRRVLKGFVICFEIDQLYALLYFFVLKIADGIRIEFKVRVFKSVFELSEGKPIVHIYYLLPFGGRYERINFHG